MQLMARIQMLLAIFLVVVFTSLPELAFAQLRQNFYANTCPNVEKIVRQAVELKLSQTFTTVPGTLRLFFHDCFVNGCDASIMIQSTPNNKAEKDYPDNLSLAGDGFDTIVKAKAAVDNTPGCTNKVSCADIMAIATRDVINLAGGPFYPVELGRLDGLVSTAASVAGHLPTPDMDLDQLTALFNKNGLSQADMIALSGAHTVGFSHCSKFSNRLYSFSQSSPVDPTLNKDYAAQLKVQCPQNVDPRIAVPLDPTTPRKFDNNYYQNLIKGMGLLTSDEVLYTDGRSKPLVVDWAANTQHFNQAFIAGITKLGRVGVKTASDGNIRIKCDAFN
ncbi:Peroxidase 50 [Ancistrocladus abbreviatus]